MDRRGRDRMVVDITEILLKVALNTIIQTKTNQLMVLLIITLFV